MGSENMVLRVTGEANSGLRSLCSHFTEGSQKDGKDGGREAAC